MARFGSAWSMQWPPPVVAIARADLHRCALSGRYHELLVFSRPTTASSCQASRLSVCGAAVAETRLDVLLAVVEIYEAKQWPVFRRARKPRLLPACETAQ